MKIRRSRITVTVQEANVDLNSIRRRNSKGSETAAQSSPPLSGPFRRDTQPLSNSNVPTESKSMPVAS